MSLDPDLLKQPIMAYRRLRSFLPPWRTGQMQDSSLEERWSKSQWIKEGPHHSEYGEAELLRKLRDDLSSIGQRVLGVEQQLKAFIEEMMLKRDDGRRSEWAEGTNNIRIPAEFWHVMRRLLAAKIQDGRTISNEKGSQRAATSHGEETDNGNHTWDGFLEENVMALQNLVDERIAVYSKDQFLDLVRSETRMIWAGIEERMMDRLARSRGGSGFASSESAAKTKNEILWELTSRAVEEHPADVLEKPDYALYNAGGRVIPELTFTDYFQHKHGIGVTTWPRRLFARLLQPRSLTTRLAEKAIQPSMHPGDCWAMNGSLGQIGIRLTRNVVVTAVTIEHVDPRVALDKGSAPREIEVWSLIAPLEGCDGQRNTGRRESEELHQSPIKGTWWKEGSPCPGASRLTTLEYKSRTQYGSDWHLQDLQNQVAGGHTPSLRQTFPIPLSRQKVASRGILLKINSNWGHPEFTCLYRVRVHGHH
ncbi:hypothetical protein BGZ72_006618 [Mortierella alpina]|nr:hypothetical protein BGZ72_006618 [Mortierella alpina]